MSSEDIIKSKLKDKKDSTSNHGHTKMSFKSNLSKEHELTSKLTSASTFPVSSLSCSGNNLITEKDKSIAKLRKHSGVKMKFEGNLNESISSGKDFENESLSDIREDLIEEEEKQEGEGKVHDY